MSMIGIYKWTNKINNKSYIGKSVNIEHRTSTHISRSQDPKSNEYSSVFHQAIRKYGIESFDFSILKVCSKEELNYWEEYYIKKENTKVPYGYNVASGGEGGFGTHMLFTENDVLNIIQDLRNTNLFTTELAKKWGCSSSLIKKVNRGEEYHIEGEDYPIRKEEQMKTIRKMIGSYTSENNPGTILTRGDVENIIWDLCNTDISINQLAVKYHISSDHISRINNNKVWKEIVRPVPCRNIRLSNQQKALAVADLLMTTDMSINEIASTVGYKDRHTISRINQHVIYKDLLKEYPNPIRK